MSSRFERGQAVSLRSKPPADIAVFPCTIAIPVGEAASSSRERYLLCSRAQIVELSTVDQEYMSRVMQVYDLVSLFKINIKKTGNPVLRIQFKSDAALCYYMPKAVECVAFIKQQMASIGVEGTVTRGKANARAIESAQAFYEQFFLIEKQFTRSPRVDLVRDVMDLLREATERFSEACDERYLAVLQQIKAFLARPEVDSLLQQTWTEGRGGAGAAVDGGGESYDSEEEASHNSAFGSTNRDGNNTNNNSSSSNTGARKSIGDGLQAAMVASSASSDSFEDGSAARGVAAAPVGGGDDGLSAELDGLLGDMAAEFSSLLESYGGGDDEGLSGGGGEFDMREFDELMRSHGVDSE